MIKVNSKIKNYCNDCHHETWHNVLFVKTITDSSEEISWSTDYGVLQCAGCDRICFKTESSDSESYDIDERGNWIPIINTKNYPPTNEGLGEIENLYYADVNRVVGGLVDSFPSAALLISRFVFSLIALAIIDYRFLLGILAFGILFVGFGYFYSKKYKKYQKRAIESDAEINKFMLESFSNLKLLKSLNSENRALERNNEDLKNNETIKRKRNYFSILIKSNFFN